MFTTLIVEDNLDFHDSLNRILHTQFPTMTMLHAGDGEEALRMIDRHSPDLIFMDISLPGKNGFEVTKVIRANGSDAIVAIITISDLPEYREAAFKCGASHFVAKDTVRESDICTLVKSAIAGTKAQ